MQSTWREYGLFLVAMSSPVNPSTLNFSGTSVPEITVVTSAVTPSNPRSHFGCVSNASVPSLRPNPPAVAP